MANLWDHPAILATEALTHLEDKLVVSKMCAIDKTSEFSTTSNGWKVGDTVSFRTHGDYKVDEFVSTISTQPIQSSRRSMTIEKHFDISVELTTREMALDLDSFADQVLRPAAYRLAEKVDAYAATKILHGAGLYTSLSLFDTVADVACQTIVMRSLTWILRLLCSVKSGSTVLTPVVKLALIPYNLP